MTWPLVRVISGGQTGADQAGLFAAEALGYQTGGMLPKDARTEAGARPDLIERFGLLESRFVGYEHRTRQNIINSDGTVICTFGPLDGGSDLTKRMCDANGKAVFLCAVPSMDATPYDVTRVVVDLRGWIAATEIGCLNVAGNRESKAPGIYDATYRLLMKALAR